MNASSARNSLAGLLLGLAFACNWTSAASSDAIVDARYSAHWYDPERSGEGWMLEILGPGQALLYWFTYDEDGGQRWLTAVGNIDGAVIDFPDLVLTRGGRFGVDFDPDQVVRERVGSARLEFDDCNRGQFHYGAFGQEQALEFERLTSTAGLDCGSDGGPISDRFAGRSGSWYDPARSGEGYTLHWMNEDAVLMVWFSYGPDGGQHWMLGIGEPQDDGNLLFPDVHDTRGARFGAGFDPDDVERRLWGELRLTLDCEDGSASFQPVADVFTAGAYTLERLTVLAAAQCAPDTGTDWTQAQWQMRTEIGPRLSEFPAVSHGGSIYVAGGLHTLTSGSNQFWRYDPAHDQWHRLADLPATRDHAMMAAADDAIFVFGGYVSGPIDGIASNLAWRYDPADDRWSAIAPMPSARSAGGAARLGDYIYLAGGMHGQHVDRYDPAADQWSSQAIDDPATRDHSAVVALDGELWLLGGRDHGGGLAHGEVTIFDPHSGQSRAGPTMPRGRSGFAAAVADGQLIVTGGESLFPLLMVGGADLYSREHGWRAIAAPALIVHGGPAVFHHGRYHLLLGSTAAGGIINPGRVQVLVPGEGIADTTL